MVYGTDPFSAQNATNNDPNNAPSVFGALPYPGSASSVDPPLHTRVTFRFTSFHPTILDCSVFGPNNETYYRVVTAGQGLTLLKNAAGQNVALIEWQSHPTVEAQAVAKQPVGQWLSLSPDRRVRGMIHSKVLYTWAPVDRFLLLFAPGASEWLARVTKTYDAVLLELSTRAIELGLVDSAVLATVLLQSGRSIS
ncbi:hypothetical protein JVT61DRAFT_15266 [Boletus reticuloceps]|uniref:Uncharacterized protein n=1 Tax=Boletus reticuloceps TaxID=495285 RepID=A0A8I2YST1_9AGAM|nr:hypothetical protein JVT61DRAFT_15266 [Boletus reticuloceps]